MGVFAAKFKTNSFTTEDTGVHRGARPTGSGYLEMMTGTCWRSRAVPVLLFFFLLFLFVPALLAQSPVTIRVDAGKSMGPLQRVWEYFGYDEPNYTYMAHGKELIGELAAMSPGRVQIRTHNLLTTGDGTPALKWGSTNAYTEDAAGRPVYDWTIVDRIFETYLQAGAKPFVEIGFMPEALSTHPEPYRHHWPKDDLYSGWAYPPQGLSRSGRNWSISLGLHCDREIRKGRGSHLGLGSVERAEYRLLARHGGRVRQALRLRGRRGASARCRKRMSAVRRRRGRISKGGGVSAAVSGALRARDEFCDRKNGAPLDFITFHAKGSPRVMDGHVRMGLAHANLRDVDAGFGLSSSFPQFAKLPIVLSESDPGGLRGVLGA